MSNDITSTPATPTTAEENLIHINIGDWFYKVAAEEKEDVAKGVKMIYCVMHLGSNYAQLTSPLGGECRIKLSEFALKTKRVDDVEEYLRERAESTEKEIRKISNKISKISKELGLQQAEDIRSGGNSIMVTKTGTAIKQYKNDLEKAQKETLPKLFQKMRDETEKLTTWLSAKLLPLNADIKDMRDYKELIEGRIFNIELYAGLLDDIVTVKKGAPAPEGTKLYVFQNRLHMDEECLVTYQPGGLTYDKIDDFDEWLAKDENLNRILPYPRTIVAFRIRNSKYKFYKSYGDFMSFFSEDPNMKTFFYIRNGENLYRLSTGIEFGEQIFPSRKEFDFGEALYIKAWGSSRVTDSDNLIGARERRRMIADIRAKFERERIAWKKEKHADNWPWTPIVNARSELCRLKDYKLVSKESVFYDDAEQIIAKRLQKYNRIVVILQGLFDRSDILHPHEKVALWDYQSFEKNLKLIYDGEDTALSTGDKPDFDKYRESLNGSLKVGDFTTGQQVYWEIKMARIENDRQRRSWKVKNPDNYERYTPWNMTGPGQCAEVINLTKTHATFNFVRNYKEVRVRIPRKNLLNASAYKLGDFKQFYNDPRTRREYIKWVEYLLPAEDYQAKINGIKFKERKETDNISSNY